MKRWRLSNRSKPAGQLARAGRFLAPAGKLSACRVSVPVEMDSRAAVLAAGGLASAGTRSFELWWDGGEKRLDVALVAESSDLASYRQALRNMYPNAAFEAMESPVPAWFPAEQAQIFDVGTYHGHYAAVFDKSRAHQLIGQMANTVQLSGRAWIQFAFRLHPFNGFLRRHVARLDSRYREIARGRYLSNAEILMHPDRKPHEHPEMGYDYTNNYAGLQKHATLKMQGAHVLMSVRGAVVSDGDLDLHFDEIEALPVENIHSGHEHLTKFRYKYSDFAGGRKARVRAGGQRVERIDMFPLRLLPDPAKFLDPATGAYFDRGLFGYRERRPLPFLVLNLSEMPLLVHLPAATTPNVSTTRGVALPSRPSEKEGANVGFFGPAPPGFDWPGAWGAPAKSKDAGAAVVSPSDFATHVYAVGASGAGKTSLIRLLAKHLEAWNARGFPNAFVYLDPKGDDSQKFVRQCSPGSLASGRVHFLDPQATKFSINPLELPPYAPGEREETVSRYVGYFMKTVEEWYQQPGTYVQMERIFRALLFYLYMRHDAPTFLDIHETVLKLQERKADALPEIIRAFGEPDPEMEQALESIASLKGEAFTPLLNRVEQFATDPVLRRMFSVRRGTVDFADLIRPGAYTVVRISPLNMPQHVQPLAMQAFILKLWFTIQERANRVPDEKGRTQVVLALDEFQIVKDLQVLQLMLEQARSLGLGLVLSHQTTEQISDRQLGIITGNSGTQLVGRVNGRDAGRIAQIWDPQFQKEIQQQLASQEYFHWTLREKAPPGKEQPPPSQFWLAPPPEALVDELGYGEFVASQLEKYGRGVPGSAGAAAREARTRWTSQLTVRLPGKTEWKVMLALRHGQSLQQGRIVDILRAPNRAGVLPVLRDMEARGILERPGGGRAAPYRLAEEAKEAYFRPECGAVGTAADVAGLCLKAFEAYMSWGMFVAVAGQRISKGRDRTDLVAYDYEAEVPVSVEIESASEVASHREHVRYNMVKWRRMGFGACHVWSSSPRVREIYETLDERDKKVVEIVVT